MNARSHSSLDSIKTVHFVGIGGIGMSALAQLCAHEGKKVTGSDRDPSPKVHELLSSKGIEVFVGHSADNVREGIDLVVYSDAVPEDNPERAVARERSIRQLSYFEALGEVTKGRFAVVVSGTHGKTTTTGMLAKILIDAGLNPTVIVGSIVKDFGSNFVAGDPDLFVVEGCEYKRHFTNFSPNVFVITNLELDHTDYYADLASMQDAFREVLQKVPAQGAIIANPFLPGVSPILSEFGDQVVDYTKEIICDLHLPGAHNVANAQAAKAAAKAAIQAKGKDVPEAELDASLASFEGTWRRFEYKGQSPLGAIVIDDYAHHPTAIEATLKATREKYPRRRIAVLFQPHTYTRTKSFFKEFAEALALSDEVVLMEVYAAREAPIPEVSSERLAEAVNAAGGSAKSVKSLDDAYDVLREYDENWILLSLGAGEQYKVAERLVAEA
jgi:UDP-N-acetylmuramate--alanine ligase